MSRRAVPSGPRRFRFAPSPNGFLHLGHAYSALLNQERAAAVSGEVLLRIENIDLARCAPGFEAAIAEDLDWIGFAWTPPVIRQSDRMNRYAEVVEGLAARDLLYPCFCTRGDIGRAIAGKADWPHDPDGSPLYPGTCRGLSATERRHRISAGARPAFRLDLAKALADVPEPLTWHETGSPAGPADLPAEPRRWGDVLLARKDIRTSYHVAVVSDDADQGITDVVRGLDLLAATGVHRLLQVLLGFPAPAYHHHGLILDAQGAKLAKSAGSPTLRDRRAAGWTASAIREELGFAAGY